LKENPENEGADRVGASQKVDGTLVYNGNKVVASFDCDLGYAQARLKVLRLVEMRCELPDRKAG
jgi:hypothetical protein